MIFINRRYRSMGRQLLGLLIGIGLLFLLFKMLIAPLFAPRRFISPIPDVTPIAKSIFGGKKEASPTPSSVPLRNSDELIKSIKTLTDKAGGTYSVYVVDLNTNQTFGFNETTIYTAASVNKIPILAALYHEANTGKVDLDQRITIQAADIQDYGTGIIRYQGPGQVYSLKSLAQIMIEKSDNTAAYVLSSVLSLQKIQDLLESWGLTQTDIFDNKTSNKDMATLMIKMRKGEITSRALTQEMIGFMDDSDFETRIPRLLPKDLAIYHKIGTEVGNIHDVAIVEDPKHPFYLGVMSNDVTDDSAAEEIIAKVAKVVFDFMNQS